MLDPWIIEEILKREQEERRREEQNRRVELPIEINDRPPTTSVTPPREENQRGVMIIDI